MKHIFKNSATQAEKLQVVRDILKKQIVDLYERGELGLTTAALLFVLKHIDEAGVSTWVARVVNKIDEADKVIIIFSIEEKGENDCKISVVCSSSTHKNEPIVDWGVFIDEMKGNMSDGLCTCFITNRDAANLRYYFVEDVENIEFNKN